MAEGNGLIAAPYLTLFDNGQTLPQVLQAITNDYKAAQVEREAQAAREAAEVATSRGTTRQGRAGSCWKIFGGR